MKFGERYWFEIRMAGLVVSTLLLAIGILVYAHRKIESCIDTCAPYAVKNWLDDGSCLCDTTVIVRSGNR